MVFVLSDLKKQIILDFEKQIIHFGTKVSNNTKIVEGNFIRMMEGQLMTEMDGYSTTDVKHWLKRSLSELIEKIRQCTSPNYLFHATGESSSIMDDDFFEISMVCSDHSLFLSQ